MSLTISGLQRAELCPGSRELRQVDTLDASEHRDRGTAIHAYLEAVASGHPSPLEVVPEEYRDECEAIDLDEVPHGQAGAWAAEVAFALDVEQGTARELGRNLGRAYGELRASEIAGTADLVGVTADSVVVLDVKTGRAELGRPEASLQLLGYAVAAAKAYGRSSAVVGFLRVFGSDVSVQTATVDALDLDLALERIREVVAAKPAPRLAQGSHCSYCPAFTTCPSKVGLVLAAGELAAAPWGELYDAALGAAWERIELLEAALSKAKAIVRQRVDRGPLPLPGGRVLVAELVERRVIDAEALAQERPDAVDTKHTASQASLKRSLAHQYGAKGVAKRLREAMDELEARGVVRRTTHPEYKTRDAVLPIGAETATPDELTH